MVAKKLPVRCVYTSILEYKDLYVDKILCSQLIKKLLNTLSIVANCHLKLVIICYMLSFLTTLMFSWFLEIFTLKCWFLKNSLTTFLRFINIASMGRVIPAFKMIVVKSFQWVSQRPLRDSFIIYPSKVIILIHMLDKHDC